MSDDDMSVPKWLWLVLCIILAGGIGLTVWMLAPAGEPAPVGADTVAVAQLSNQQPPDDRDDREAEIERLRMENAQLQEALLVRREEPVSQPPQQQPAATPAQPTAAASVEISGDAWIVRKSGASDLLRGLRVYLLPAAVSPGPFVAMLNAEIPRWEELIDSYEGLRRDAQQSAQSSTIRGLWDNQIADCTNTIEDYKQRIGRIEQFAEQASEPIDPAQAFAFATEHTTSRSEPSAIMPRMAIMTTTTNAQGKFNFKNVPPGFYTIYAAFDSEALYIAWVLPVDASAAMAEVQLFNDNALEIMNRN